MTEKTAALKQLQKLDNEILSAKERRESFEPQIEEVELPALELEAELAKARNRLEDLRKEERRLARNLEVNSDLVKRLEEKGAVARNLREVTAVSNELEMVKRSLQNDEQDIFAVLEQIKRLEEGAGSLAERVTEARAEVEPKKLELLEEQSEADRAYADLLRERERLAEEMDRKLRQLYESVSRYGSREAVAELDSEACGHCYAVVPIQQRNYVLAGRTVQCEACGVILTGTD